MNDAARFFVLFSISMLLGGCSTPPSSEPIATVAPSPAWSVSLPEEPPSSALTPASLLPAATSTPLPAAELPLPTQTPDCTNNLTFLEDLTIPDGSLIAPGNAIDKRWKVTNSGECNWDSRYTLRLIAGPDLGAREEQALYPGRSGAEATLQIIFEAPVEPGAYRSVWQAHTPLDQPFGDPITLDILVSP